jgi:hypothetical protein
VLSESLSSPFPISDSDLPLLDWKILKQSTPCHVLQIYGDLLCVTSRQEYQINPLNHGDYYVLPAWTLNGKIYGVLLTGALGRRNYKWDSSDYDEVFPCNKHTLYSHAILLCGWWYSNWQDVETVYRMSKHPLLKLQISQDCSVGTGYRLDRRGSIPGKDNTFFSTPQGWDRFWGPTSFL